MQLQRNNLMRHGNLSKIGNLEPYLAVYKFYEKQSDYKSDKNSPISKAWDEWDYDNGNNSATGIDIKFSYFYNDDGTLNGDFKQKFGNRKTPFYAFFKTPIHPDYKGNGEYELITTMDDGLSYEQLNNIIVKMSEIEEFTDDAIFDLEGEGGVDYCVKIVDYLGLPTWVCKYLKYWWVPVVAIAANQAIKKRNNDDESKRNS